MDSLDKRVIEYLLPRLSPEILVLFGSMAAGNFRVDSDIDIAFLSLHKVDPYSVFMVAQGLALEISRDVDLVDLSKAGDVLKMQIFGKGKVIYDNQGSSTTYFARAMKDYTLLNEERSMVLRKFLER